MDPAETRLRLTAQMHRTHAAPPADLRRVARAGGVDRLRALELAARERALGRTARDLLRAIARRRGRWRDPVADRRLDELSRDLARCRRDGLAARDEIARPNA